MAAIVLEGVTKRYRDTTAVDHLDLEIADGELMVLVGPSGCGKSTTLRLVAGLTPLTSGTVRLGGRDLEGVAPQDRGLAMVFQSYALYPHKTVRANLEFPLRMMGRPKGARAARVAEVARELDLEPLLDRRPRQLSGGQRQRVALGRALVREPEGFLLDEPLSNLDAALRVRTRAALARLHRRLQATMIHVTHDQEEAMTLGDRVAVLDAGRLVQVAKPLTLYRAPATVFVARFIGSPSMNLVECVVEDGHLVAPGISLSPGAAVALPGAGKRVILGARPEDLRLVPEAEADVVATVEGVEPLGPTCVVRLAGPPPLTATVAADAAPGLGDRVGVRLVSERLHLFDPRTGRRQGPEATDRRSGHAGA